MGSSFNLLGVGHSMIIRLRPYVKEQGNQQVGEWSTNKDSQRKWKWKMSLLAEYITTKIMTIYCTLLLKMTYGRKGSKESNKEADRCADDQTTGFYRKGMQQGRGTLDRLARTQRPKAVEIALSCVRKERMQNAKNAKKRMASKVANSAFMNDPSSPRAVSIKPCRYSLNIVLLAIEKQDLILSSSESLCKN